MARNMSCYLAADLGAESGRVMLGTLAGGRLEIEELRRFANQPVELPSGLYWDAFRLFHEIVEGLAVAGRERHLQPAGIGVDTWGVDFGLLAADGGLIDCPRHYRDPRTNGVPERLFESVPRARVFARTGVQIMSINSLYQVYSMRLAHSAALDNAARLLFMPDLLNYWLTGIERNEVTIASTSQMYDPNARRFAGDMLERLGIPSRILGDLIEPGSTLGPLLPRLAAATGLGAVPVHAVGSHDTASAVAAVPASGDGWCYISSGTWSLMGVETAAPVIGDESYKLNFTNEAGVGGRTRLLKNIAGLWLLQECRRAWAAEGERFGYEELMQMAEAAGPARAIVDPDDFLQPGDMPARIAAWCEERSLEAPKTKGEFCRTILESLAQRYREVLEGLEGLTHARIDTIHIVGGGSRNSLLNQLVANATGRTVVAGPVEATAAGNLLVQAIAAGEVSGLEETRAIVRQSFAITRFQPKPKAAR
jgi:rhamnulokinase